MPSPVRPDDIGKPCFRKASQRPSGRLPQICPALEVADRLTVPTNLSGTRTVPQTNGPMPPGPNDPFHRVSLDSRVTYRIS